MSAMLSRKSARAVSQLAERWRAEGLTVGLVPTMGALHEGHLSLIRSARTQCDKVIVSIFVNPAQFSAHEDLDRYPQPIAKDIRLLKESGCDLLFRPGAEDMYAPNFDTWVNAGTLGSILEGKARPNHFRGVATVCLKLFQICKPHRAYFGQKDFQQTRVIDHMIQDLNLNLKLMTLPIIREPDGLAMSSRNRFLSEGERTTAAHISSTMLELAQRLKSRRRSPGWIEREGRKQLSGLRGLELDYFVVRSAATLQEPLKVDRELVILVAASVGSTRLIDNVKVRLKKL
jgi:pantoate--beta-alanine ligase